MPITDLLSKIPFSPGRRPEGAPPAGGPQRTFNLELPAGRSGPAVAAAPAAAAATYVTPPLPSYGVATIGGLSLLCLALATALGVALSTPTGAAPTPAASAPTEASEAAPAASFTAEPRPIPVDLITQLEASTDHPMEVELSSLLGAIQYGFGAESARLEPTLHSYADRMVARFAWTPVDLRVDVTAPTPDLAEARADLLRRLFAKAVADGRLRVNSGTGPHALTLVSE